MKRAFLGLVLSQSLFATLAWHSDPVTLPEATAASCYLYDLNFEVDTDSSDPIQFSKLSGSGLFSVSSDGIVSGCAKPSQVGTYHLTVRASNSNDSATASINIDVIPAP